MLYMCVLDRHGSFDKIYLQWTTIDLNCTWLDWVEAWERHCSFLQLLNCDLFNGHSDNSILMINFLLTMFKSRKSEGMQVIFIIFFNTNSCQFVDRIFIPIFFLHFSSVLCQTYIEKNICWIAYMRIYIHTGDW